MPDALYLGIDIGIDRGCAFSAIDDRANMVESGWFEETPPAGLLNLMVQARDLGRAVHVGIDAPRCPLPAPRAWYWSGLDRSWRPRRDERGTGRHCEVVLKAHGLGNPQWTPLESDAIPEWMRLGFRVFQAFEAIPGLRVHEVFPTASYILLEGQQDLRVSVEFSEFRAGPKDLLDACVAAATIREFGAGRGDAVGNGDGLGAIILPRKLRHPVAEVLAWPGAAIVAA